MTVPVTPDGQGGADSDAKHFLFRMTPALSTLIHGFKYRHYPRHVRFLCAYFRFRPDLRDALNSVDVLVPVPIHAARRRERGYNQAEKIAEELSAWSGVPVASDALKRVRPTKSQTRLNKEDRGVNLRNAMVLGRASKLAGMRVLLVDDVYTTGATARACVELLRKAGCQSVDTFAFARVEVDRDKNDFELELELELASAYFA